MRAASFPCKHRHTGKWICGIPCDGEDDFCEDYSDEKCGSDAFVYALAASVMSVVVTVAFTEVIYRWKSNVRTNQEDIPLIQTTAAISQTSSRRSLKGFRSFILRSHSSDECSSLDRRFWLACYWSCSESLRPKLCRALMKAETRLHKGNHRRIHFCVKKLVGTGKLAKKILSRPKGPAIGNLFRRNKRKGGAGGQKRLSVIWLAAKQLLKTCLNISFYYLDMAKDFAVIYFSSKIIGDASNAFASFGSQVLFLMWTSVLLPFFVNAVFLFDENPLKKYDSRAARVLLAALSPLAPAFAIAMAARLTFKSKIWQKKLRAAANSKAEIFRQTLSEKKAVDRELLRWSKLIVGLKMTEISLENLIQTMLLSLLILLKHSTTVTVTSWHELYAGGQVDWLLVSAAWSLLSMMISSAKFLISTKSGFLPLAGIMVMSLKNLVSIVSRVSATILYFTPCLGLFSLLKHVQFGSLPITTKDLLFDVAENGSRVNLSQVWRPVNDYTDLTLIDASSYYVAFFALILVYLASVAAVKFNFAIGFRGKQRPVRKVLHVLSHLLMPLTFKDWDEVKATVPQDFNVSFQSVFREMKHLTILSTAFHLFLCCPLWVLSYSVGIRNEYLEEFFPMIEEERAATRLINVLASVCPLLFVGAGCFEYGLFVLYHRFGHPWAKIVHGEDGIDRGQTSRRSKTRLQTLYRQLYQKLRNLTQKLQILAKQLSPKTTQQDENNLEDFWIGLELANADAEIQIQDEESEPDHEVVVVIRD